MVRSLCALLLLSFALQAQGADTLFEGYAKLVVNGHHVGYVISRYEFDSKKNQFASAYFLKTGKGGTEVTESLKAFATADLVPLSYEYTSVVGKDTKTIDAKFKNGTMSALVKTNGKISRVDKKIPKGTFLSTFLIYLMMKSKEGLKSESKYEYQAIAEEDASIQKGQALVGKEETYNGFKAFKILNTFKDSKFLSYVNDRGEVLGTNVIAQGVSTELVGSMAEATKDQAVSSTLLSAIFGSVPKGDNNIIARARAVTPATKNQTKTEGVPAGEGLQIKAETDKKEEK